MINGQAVIHYSRHPLITASAAYVTTLTYASTNDRELILLAHWSVCHKLNRVTSVQFSLVTSLCTRF